MSGRIEKENQYAEKSKALLEKMPYIATQYYVYFKSSSSRRTEASCHTYLSNLKLYLEYLRKRKFDINSPVAYKKVKPLDITMFIDDYRNNGDRPKKDCTVAVMFNVVKSFYIFLEDNDYITKNPCGRLKAPKINQQVKPVSMTQDEVNKVKDYILYADKSFYHNDQNEEYWRLRDYLIFTLGCRTGLRCSAIVAIDISDIDMENNTILVTEKGNVTKNIYFGENTKEIIKEWITARWRLMPDEGLDALFVSRKKCRISSSEIGRIIRKYTSEVIPNKHITPHKMRSTCATNLWEKTHDIYMVANQLGHKNLANTKRYTDISESESRRVSDMMDEF